MGKRYSKRSTRKVKLRLSPKDAQKIIETEFTDSKGNKTYVDFNVTPHNPFKTPTIQGFRDYKQDNGDK